MDFGSVYADETGDDVLSSIQTNSTFSMASIFSTNVALSSGPKNLAPMKPTQLQLAPIPVVSPSHTTLKRTRNSDFSQMRERFVEGNWRRGWDWHRTFSAS
jgi:hypothetical protein